MGGIKRGRQQIPCLPPGTDNQSVLTSQDLVKLGIFCLFGKQAPGCGLSPPDFVKIHAPQEIKRWVMIFAPRLRSEDQKWLDNMFNLRFPIDSPATKFGLSPELKDFQWVPTKKQKHSQSKDSKSNPCKLSDLVIDPELIEQFGYPQKGVSLNKIPGDNKAFAMDCEMCLCGDSSVLTRVAVIDFFSEELIYDQLVKPKEPITDYLTQYSGITAEMLENVETTLEDVQNDLRKLIGQTDFLIGHSLDCDLRALSITHNKCIDTSILFPHKWGLPRRVGLKQLCKQFLNVDIQNDPVKGHSPTEDALACVHLVKLKLENGFEFGIPMFENALPLSQYLKSHNLNTAIVDQKQPMWDLYGNGSHVIVSNDNEAVKRTIKLTKTNEFIFTTLRSSSRPLQQSLGEILDALPPQTLVCLWTGSGNQSDVQDLQARKKQYNRDFATVKWDEIQNPWTGADNDKLSEAVSKAKRGDAYLRVSISQQDYDSLPADLQKANTHGVVGSAPEVEAEESALEEGKKKVKHNNDDKVGNNHEFTVTEQVDNSNMESNKTSTPSSNSDEQLHGRSNEPTAVVSESESKSESKSEKEHAEKTEPETTEPEKKVENEESDGNESENKEDEVTKTETKTKTDVADKKTKAEENEDEQLQEEVNEKSKIVDKPDSE